MPEEDVVAGAVPDVLRFTFADAVAEEGEGDGLPDEDFLLQPDSEKQERSRNAAMKDRQKVEFLRCSGNSLLIKVSLIGNLPRVF